MPVGRRDELIFTGAFQFGVGPADPAMQPDGSLRPQIAVVVTEPGVAVTAVFSEDGARDLVKRIEAALAQGQSGLVLPGNGRF